MIRFAESGHIYIDEQDVSKYVVEVEVISNERVKLTLVAKIKDERQKPKPKKKVKK